MMGAEQHGPQFDPAPTDGVQPYRFRWADQPVEASVEDDTERITPNSLTERWQKLAADRRNSAMRELMDRADKALRDRTPEQVEDDRRWGEALHKSFEDIHGYSLQDVPHDEKWLARVTNGTDRQPLTQDDLEAYAEPHEADYDGGTVEWDQGDEVEL